MCVCVCVFSFKANLHLSFVSIFGFSLLLFVMHTSMESCQSYWESKTGVEADRNVLLLVVRLVNKVCVGVCLWMELDLRSASLFSVILEGLGHHMVCM